MQIEACPARFDVAALGNLRSLLTRRISLVSASALVGWLVCVCLLTAATHTRILQIGALASSPNKIVHGKLWSLLTSGLVVQQPLLISLLCLAALAGLAVVVCGPRLLWITAATGHICSTLGAYSALAMLRALRPHAFSALLARPDYGVSAISAAWLGALAATGWQWRDQTRRGKLSIVLAVAATALFAFMLRRGLTILDSDHVFAFAIGVVLAAVRPRAHRAATARATPA
jgi:hypothetical protein